MKQKTTNRILSIPATVILLLSSFGCANYDMIKRPPDGYDALRLKRQIIVDRGLRSDLTFQAGTLLVADRMSKDGNYLYYCGIGIDSGNAVSMCVTYNRRSVAITYPLTGEKYETAVTSDDIYETKN